MLDNEFARELWDRWVLSLSPPPPVVTACIFHPAVAADLLERPANWYLWASRPLTDHRPACVPMLWVELPNLSTVLSTGNGLRQRIDMGHKERAAS